MAEILPSKTKCFICPTVSSPTTLASYQALKWTEIGGTYDVGECSDPQASNDGGTIELIVNRLPTDVGQIALATAAKDDFDRPFKIVLPDRLAATGKDSEFYFCAAVLGGRIAKRGADNVVRTTWGLAVYAQQIRPL